MLEDEGWLSELFEEQGATLHRLTVLLGAESAAGHIIRSALLGLSRRERRIIDPADRVEYLIEHVVHHARSVRGSSGSLHLPDVADPRQGEICRAVADMPVRLGEHLLVAHYLSLFGTSLAGVMRMTLKGSNQRLRDGLEHLRRAVGDPAPTSQPGAVETLSDELTAALRAAARLVQAPGTETLELELRVLRATRGGLPLWASSIIVAGALVIGGSLAWATTGHPGAVPSPSPSPTTMPSAVPSRSIPSQVMSVPVYYVGRNDALLYRELRDLPVSGSMVQTALNAILSLAPLDPDYDSAWTPGRILAVEVNEDLLTIDLSAESYVELVSDGDAVQAVDQMVYTASEILGNPDLKVQFRSNGGLPPEPFRGEHRRAGLSPLGKLWINTPSNMAKLQSGPVIVSGLVQGTPDAPRILVTDSQGVLLTSLFAQIDVESDPDGWRAWTVTVDLPAGEYQVVAESTLGEAAAPQLVQQSRTITVE
ncbi:GerMN domain-containing protein [Arachnia propionica]|uniref:GerMN domain-containing protein n=1 Tax=Arachnia propionica TaxID=1750 RepID=UPI000F5F3399|nr:GerMN domain-containing protein [Arachnia propionica]MDO5083215.1 GerMN domain-containing protein [Arachnia propionica]